MQKQLQSSLQASGWITRLEAFITTSLQREEHEHTKLSPENIRKKVLMQVMDALKTPARAREQGLRVPEEDLHATIDVLQEILAGICQVVDETEYEVE